MASLRISPRGMLSSVNHSKKPHQRFQPSPSLQLTKKEKTPAPLKISASTALSSPPPINLSKGIDRNQETSIFPANLDQWMRDSAAEIVKNLKKAPLLVSVHSEVQEGNLKSSFKTEKAIEEKWPVLKDEWERGKVKCPCGIIYVKEVFGEDKFEGIVGEAEEEEGVTRAWGILVQGKSGGGEMGRRPVVACYLLKTCRVEGGLGMGLFCTHFCLVKVKSFKDSALKQLQDCWLLNNGD